MRLESPIRGERVKLDTFMPHEVDSQYIGWLNDPEVMRFTEVVPGTYDHPLAERYVTQNLSSSDTLLMKIYAPEGQDGTLVAIGTLRMSGIGGRHRRAEIALILGERRAHGKGYGTQVIAAATDAAFKRFNLHKVSAGIYGPNLASCRAFEKAGFEKEAVLREHAIYDEKFVDVIRFAKFSETGKTT
jgi:[ribosomal protein S5]-alanine N-acetyltransferase